VCGLRKEQSMARSVATSDSAPHPDWHSQVPRGELGVIRLHNPWPLYHVIWCQEHAANRKVR
jgi:hypothetical protein